MSVLAFPTTERAPVRPLRRRHLTAVPAVAPPRSPVPGARPAQRPRALVRPVAVPSVAPLPVTPLPAAPAPARVRTAAGPVRPLAASGQTVRLTARGRRVLVTLGFAVAAVVGSVAGTMIGSSDEVPAAVRTVTVLPGQSLWTIASGIAAPGEDVRVVIDQIRALNGLDGSVLSAGERLALPAG